MVCRGKVDYSYQRLSHIHIPKGVLRHFEASLLAFASVPFLPSGFKGTCPSWRGNDCFAGLHVQLFSTKLMVPQKTEWMLALTFFLGTESRKPTCSQLQHVYHLSYSRGIGGHQASRRFFWFSTSSYKSCMLRASKLTNIHHHKYLSESNKRKNIYIICILETSCPDTSQVSNKSISWKLRLKDCKPNTLVSAPSKRSWSLDSLALSSNLRWSFWPIVWDHQTLCGRSWWQIWIIFFQFATKNRETHGLLLEMMSGTYSCHSTCVS